MNNEIDVIEEYPFRPAPALHVGGPPLQMADEPVLDAFGDGEDLPVGASVADDEEIGDVTQPPKIEHHELFGFFLPGRLDALCDFGEQLIRQRGSSFKYRPLR